MSIARDLGLLEKYNEFSKSLQMKICVTHEQITEIVVADLMIKYKAANDENKQHFAKVLNYYLDDEEFVEMLDIVKT